MSAGDDVIFHYLGICTDWAGKNLSEDKKKGIGACVSGIVELPV